LLIKIVPFISKSCPFFRRLEPASHLRVKGAARITGSAQRLQDVEARSRRYTGLLFLCAPRLIASSLFRASLRLIRCWA